MLDHEIAKKVHHKLGTQIYQTEGLFDRMGFTPNVIQSNDGEGPVIFIQGPSQFKFPYFLRVELLPDFDIVYAKGKDTIRFTTLEIVVSVNPHAFDYPEYKDFEDAYRTFKDNVTKHKKTFKLWSKESDNMYSFIESKLLEVVKEADEATKIYVKKMIDIGQTNKVIKYLSPETQEIFFF